MSVLIKGMEMPKNCGECHFCHTENFHQWCCLTEETISAIDAKHFMCPLTQLEPCEDVISRQAAIDAILAVTGNSSVRELYEHVQEHGLSEMWSGGVNAAIDIIIAVPSAQPEKETCKDCKWEYAFGYGECHHCRRRFENMWEAKDNE